MELVDELVKTLPIDPKRIYVTGTSMGGGGAWDFAAIFGAKIAAVMPMAGHPLKASDVASLATSKVGVWAQHGDGDENNPVADTIASVAALKAAGGCGFISVYPKGTTATVDPGDPPGGNDLNHTVWMRGYMQPKMWDWLFSNKLP
jgi:predicted peptidase